ncbi:hypothetical protein DCO58_08970 [Helicobacter saguini]|uniref:ABC-type transport auxiliary lipoprotein component domain-containing protein n=1 Tax=Helicobacter saguini TaxID=1548018 RepID=A0A347VP17_9HELI|nr:hypothetical protein [Helicobacter saguini]MWV61548.1 hypothetical protein [Helicobacter saguini]MWV67782.1 hypothetical protein [Helicobacter saguini]MWV70750.1 hypothetical protein [Helicobacter saguini]MWV72654.1 hypothetical protein [Helicobacter saguini]TLD94542.1 hypothetical protein LS64_005070 [Helicobacter saguini]
MFRICVMCVFCVFLQGCLNVNLKSVLPKEEYFSLDSIVLNPCKKMESTYNLSVNVLSPYDGKDILVNNAGQIKVLDTYKWVDLPKNMVRNAMIKVGANHCVSIESSGIVGQKTSTIRLNINDLYLTQNGSEYNAHIYATYEIINYDLSRAKSNILVLNANDTNPIKALQSAISKGLENVVLGIGR